MLSRACAALAALVAAASYSAGAAGATTASASDFDAFAATYRTAFARDPPPGMKSWFEFAKLHGCATAHSDYARIYADLQVFRDRHAQRVQDGIRNASSPVLTAADVEDAARLNGVEVAVFSGGRLVSNMPYYHWLLAPLTDLPDMTAVFNLLDEPRILKHRVLRPDHRGKLSFDSSSRWFDNKDRTSARELMTQACDPGALADGTVLSKHGWFGVPASLSVTDRLVPMFSGATVPACFSDVLVPFRTLGHLPQSDRVLTRPEFEAAWAGKTTRLFWRGSNTGGFYRNATPLTNYPRHRLVRELGPIAELFGVAVDVFAGYIQCDVEATCAAQRAAHVTRGVTNYEYAFQSKFLIDVDGNTLSGRFLPFLRRSGSLVLKMTGFDDWITAHTTPFKHYVPVAVDMRNFKATFRSLVLHDRYAAQIAAAGQRHAASRLRIDDMHCYMYRLLLEYSVLFAKS